MTTTVTMLMMMTLIIVVIILEWYHKETVLHLLIHKSETGMIASVLKQDPTNISIDINK